MARKTNIQKRVIELEEALQHLLEVQITPSTPMHDEWRAAVADARRVIRNKVVKGWKKMDTLEVYQLEEQYRIEMELDYVGAD